MYPPGPRRPHSSAVEHYLDKVEVAGSIPAAVTVMERNSVRFYGYKHWTLEAHPRCFYVGKGLHKRPYDKRRSQKWHAIVKRYGLCVEVCVGPVTNEEACSWEIRTIEEMGTFSTNFHHNEDGDVGCNFTRGGDGTPGRQVSSDAKARIGAAQHGKPKHGDVRKKISDALKGRKLSDETRQRMSVAHTGKRLSESNKKNLWKNRDRAFSDVHRAHLSDAARKRRASVETRQKMSQALRGKRHKCGHCGVIGHTRPTCPSLKRCDHVRCETSDCSST